MRISGRWLLCEDGIVRPAIEGTALAGDGSLLPVEFLVDVGADWTVFEGSGALKIGAGRHEASQAPSKRAAARMAKRIVSPFARS